MNRLFASAKVRRISALTVSAAITAAAAIPALAAPPAPSIHFTASVPAVAKQLPLYSLQVSAVPRTLIDRTLKTHTVTPFRMEEKLSVARDVSTQLVRAYINPVTNEAAVVPNLARTLPRIATVRPVLIATQLFKAADGLPKDATSYRINTEIPVRGAAVARPAAAGAAPHVVAPEATRFTFVSARRFAGGFPVYGSGSHAAFAIGTDGSVQGLLRRWKTARSAGTVAATVTGDRVRTQIIAQLQPFAAHNAITVDRIAVAYYDGNGAVLQPAYRFTAILHPLEGRAADSHIAGYVPFAQTAEAIPTISRLRAAAAQPITPVQTNDRLVLAKLSERSKILVRTNTPANLRAPVTTFGNRAAVITLGEYANRDNNLNGMADQFYTGLTLHPLFFPRFGPPIVRTQYYYAYPWEVVGPYSKNYMNAVNIAYTQPHGDWYINTTYSNYADLWDVHDIGTNGNPGFGAAAGGKLATWIVDSCEVVPSMYDMSIATGNAYDAFTPWWPVFQGLHNVIGFRTQMWLYDGLNTPFGFAAQLGGDLNAAWFQEIAADPAYNDGYTYYDPHIKLNVHMGRASTFIDARNLGQSIYNVAPQTASTTLWNFWMGN